MLIRLTHGTFSENLRICTRAYRNALADIQGEIYTKSGEEEKLNLLSVNFLMSYAFRSYEIQCQLDGKPRKLDMIEFEELFDTVQENSTVSAVFEALSQSIVSKIEGIKGASVDADTEKKSSQMTTSNTTLEGS